MAGFEQAVRVELDKRFPCSVLSNIPIYRPDVREDRLRGYEIDHLMHVSSELNDRLIIVECKEPPITGERQHELPTDNGPWNLWRRGEVRDVKRAQLRNHLGISLHDSHLRFRSEPTSAYRRNKTRTSA